MAYKVLVHISNEDPIVAEMDYIPERTDQVVIINNPRRRDGKDIHFIMDAVQTVIFPMHRISFIELYPTKEKQVVGFFREQ